MARRRWSCGLSEEWVSGEAGLTGVPWLLQASGCVDVREGLLEGPVIDTPEPVVVEVVPSGDDEVDVQLLPDPPHLQTSNIDLIEEPQDFTEKEKEEKRVSRERNGESGGGIID